MSTKQNTTLEKGILQGPTMPVAAGGSNNTFNKGLGFVICDASAFATVEVLDFAGEARTIHVAAGGWKPMLLSEIVSTDVDIILG